MKAKAFIVSKQDAVDDEHKQKEEQEREEEEILQEAAKALKTKMRKAMIEKKKREWRGDVGRDQELSGSFVDR